MEANGRGSPILFFMVPFIPWPNTSGAEKENKRRINRLLLKMKEGGVKDIIQGV